MRCKGRRETGGPFLCVPATLLQLPVAKLLWNCYNKLNYILL